MRFPISVIGLRFASSERLLRTIQLRKAMNNATIHFLKAIYLSLLHYLGQKYFARKASSRNSCIVPSGCSELVKRTKSVLDMIMI